MRVTYIKRVKKLNKSVIIFLSICIVILGAFSIFILCNNRYDKMPHLTADFSFTYQGKYLTQEEAVDLCTDLVGDYNVIFVDKIRNNTLGVSTIPLRTAYIKKGQSGWELLEVITHELVHLKYWSINETFTQFMTFKLLYESDNEILHNKGKEIAIAQCTNYEFFGTDYDCSWYILNYLKERGLC